MKIFVITIFKDNWIDVRDTLSSLNNFPVKLDIILKNGGKPLDRTQIRELNRFSNSMNISLIQQSDAGIYDAMNQALEFVNESREVKTHDWIWFLNSGDALKENGFDIEELELLDEGIKLVVGEPSIGFPKLEGVSPEISEIDYLKQKVKICHQAILFRAHLLEEKRFNSRFRIISDFCMLHDFIKSYKIIYLGTPEILVKPGGLSSRSSLRLELEVVVYLLIRFFRNPSSIFAVTFFWRLWHVVKHPVKRILYMGKPK